MCSVLISAGQPAERWVVRGIALGGNIRLSQCHNMIDCHPFRSSYILRNRSSRINAKTRNSSHERESQYVLFWRRDVILIMRCQGSQCFQDHNSTFHCHQRYVHSTFESVWLVWLQTCRTLPHSWSFPDDYVPILLSLFLSIMLWPLDSHRMTFIWP